MSPNAHPILTQGETVSPARITFTGPLVQIPLPSASASPVTATAQGLEMAASSVTRRVTSVMKVMDGSPARGQFGTVPRGLQF